MKHIFKAINGDNVLFNNSYQTKELAMTAAYKFFDKKYVSARDKYIERVLNDEHNIKFKSDEFTFFIEPEVLKDTPQEKFKFIGNTWKAKWVTGRLTYTMA